MGVYKFVICEVTGRKDW